MSRWRTRPRGSRSERGAAAVEFAIVLTLLLLILLGIIDFGRLLFVTQSVKSASREGARVAAVGALWGPDGTANRVLTVTNDAADAAVALSGGGLQSIRAAQGTTSPIDPADTVRLCMAAGPSVSVIVTVNFQWLTPVGALPGLSAPGLTGTKPVSSTTIMRCETAASP